MDNESMGPIPVFNEKENSCPHPAVVILGAGASIASCLDAPKANGQSLPSMSNLDIVVGLEDSIRKYLPNYENTNFEDFYSDLVATNEHPNLVVELENKITEWFSSLQLSDNATIYDKLILSMREKDVIATFNWDPFLLQAYKRQAAFFGEASMPQLYFLHGNVAIGSCDNCKCVGLKNAQCKGCGERLSPSQLLFPVKSKDYNSSPLLKATWNDTLRFLKGAYLITFFGYSAPKTDVEARNLLTDCLRNNTIRSQHEVEIVDILANTNKDWLEENWREFLFEHHYQMHYEIKESFLFKFPRRSCEALFEQNLNSKFIDCSKNREFSEIESVSDLQRWVQPLIKQEQDGLFEKVHGA